MHIDRIHIFSYLFVIFGVDFVDTRLRELKSVEKNKEESVAAREFVL